MTIFRKLPHIPVPEELMDIAFGRASKAAKELKAQRRARYDKARKSEEVRVKTASSEVRRVLQKALVGMPEIEELSPFYKELIRLVIDVDRFKKSLGALGWVIKKTRELEGKTLSGIRFSEDKKDIVRHRKAFYGRLSSLLRQVKGELDYLKEVNKKLRELPKLEDEFTVVIAGAPNVGKSTLLRALTGAKPRIESYPFTTKQLLLGYFENRHLRYQVVDTPGLLDRPSVERNPMEKQGVLALKLLADTVLFVFDPTETCGFPLDYQRRLYNDVIREIGATIIPVANKADLLVEDLERYREILPTDFIACSGTGGQGVQEIAERIVKERSAVSQ